MKTDVTSDAVLKAAIERNPILRKIRMNKNSITTAVIACLAGFVNPASAVNLNPNGIGQVLIYPYYTVNASQQTLLSVVNVTSIGKAVKVRFLEGYNSREVLDFNLYLSAYDVWTAVVFSLADSGNSAAGDGAFAGVFTTDNSCTDPALTASGTLVVNPAQGFQQFLNFKYTGSANSDTGPTSDARTREGELEMITMGDIVPGSTLDTDVTHIQGVPADCTSADIEAAALTDIVAPGDVPVNDYSPANGLFGSASIVDVAEGTFYAYNADAIEGFSYESLYTAPSDPQPTLSSVNDRGSPLTATSRVFADGELLTSTFPSSTAGSRAIDAVSSLFAADNLYNEYVTALDGSIGTDWVLSFPTKRFYVDAQPGGVIAGAANTFAPFEELFGANNPGQSCVTMAGGEPRVFNREGDYEGAGGCPILCPPPPPTPALCLATNVVPFANASILGSELPVQNLVPLDDAGIVQFDLTGFGHDMYTATNGNVFHGLPVTGFAAMKFINGSVALPGGGDALANYSAAYHHRATSNCTNNGGPCS
jgi:hypothetical protein